MESDYRFRGYSLSNGDPVATAQLSYDDRSGLYLNGALTGVGNDRGANFLGYQANLGFARRVNSTVSLDAGVVHSFYRYRYYGAGRSAPYSEAYVGVNAHDVSARLSYAPHYFHDGVSALYGEVEGGFQPAEKWRVSAHVGGLTYLTAPGYYDRRMRYDWRLSASRQFGAFEVHSAVSGGGPGADHSYGPGRSGTAVTVGASLNF